MNSEPADTRCPNCGKLLAQLDQLHSELEPLRLQVDALERTRRSQIAWAVDAQKCLIELAGLLQEFTHDAGVSAALKASRSMTQDHVRTDL